MGRPERFAASVSSPLNEQRPAVIVTGALAPYTHVLYERLAASIDRPLHVLSCTARETARKWVVETPRLFRHEVLPGLRWHRDAVRNLYVNPAVVTRLVALDPAAIVLNDFSPTMLMAAGFARLKRIPYLVRTDGVPETDPGQHSAPHRWLRHAIVSGARFGIGPSEGSGRLLSLYGIGPERFAVSPLFPAWSPPGPPPPDHDRPFDLLFCGILNEEVKGARFFTDVVLGCLEQGRRLTVRVAGDGPLRAEMEARFSQAGIAAQFDGYLPQSALPEAYASARLFLFPSRGDVWGIVVHEALQSGTAVLSSPHSGIARELLQGHGCGVVAPLDRDVWIEATLNLLDDAARRQALRDAAMPALQRLTPDAAAGAYRNALSTVLAST